MSADKKPRLHHIDLLRGIIILFMVVDHAMVYCLEYQVTDPMTVPGTELGIFFSRFASHFCAPLFVFLAGISAALIEGKYATGRDFAVQMIKRGLVLLFLEFTIVSWSWSFNPLFPMLYAQVIWAIAWGFISLGLLRILGRKFVLAFGLAIVLAHNLFDGISFPDHSLSHYFWSALHQKNVLGLPFGFKVRTTYPFLPIVGLMALGYMWGYYYVSQRFSAKVEKQGLILGFTCLIGYAILRGFNLYGDSSQFKIFDDSLHTIMSFFNPTKYPLSLQFMLITVGIGLIALALLRKLPVSSSQNFLQTLGKTSMFSYIIHLYLLHLISWLLIPVLGFSFQDMTYGSTLIGLPEGFGLTFGQTYCLAAVVVVFTVFLAKRYWRWKCQNRHNLIARYI